MIEREISLYQIVGKPPGRLGKVLGRYRGRQCNLRLEGKAGRDAIRELQSDIEAGLPLSTRDTSDELYARQLG